MDNTTATYAEAAQLVERNPPAGGLRSQLKKIINKVLLIDRMKFGHICGSSSVGRAQSASWRIEVTAEKIK